MSATSKLSPRREQFCQQYLKDHNGKQAAIRAGYSAHTATRQGSRLMTYADVNARIAELESELQATNDNIVSNNIRMLREVAESDVIDTSGADPVLKPGINGQLIQTLEPSKSGLKIKLYDRLRAIDLLNKMLGIYTDRVDVTSNGESINAPLTVVFEEVTKKDG